MIRLIKLDKFWYQLVILALILRFLLASFLYHSDLKWIYWQAKSFDTGIVQSYTIGISKNALAYPPPIYLFFNAYQHIFRFAFSSLFNNWLEDWSFSQTDSNTHIFRDLLIMKLPIIFFDLMVAFLLAIMAPVGKKRLIASIWLFNPFSLYSIYIFSQFDIIPTAILLVSVIVWKSNKISLSYLLLGIASGFKVYPLTLLPFWIILDKNPLKKKILNFIVFSAAFTACLLPVLKSPIVIKSIFFSNLTGGLFNVSLNLGEGREISVYLFLYGILLISALLGYLKKVSLDVVIFIILGLLLGLSSFHPQWVLWLMPFIIYLVVCEKVDWRLAAGSGICFILVSLLINDNFVGLGTLKALNNGFDTLEPLRWYLDKFGIGLKLQTFFNSIFLAAITLLVIDLITFRQKGIPSLSWTIRPFRIFGCWLIALLVIFLLAHIPLNAKGRYVDSGHTDQNAVIPLLAGTTISQEVEIKNRSINSLELRIKNVGSRSRDNVVFTILDENSGENRPFVINGWSIGDDYDLRLNFQKFANTKGHKFRVTIQAPDEVVPGTEIFVPFDENDIKDNLLVNNKLRNGSLSYSFYYNTGSYLENLNFTFGNIRRKVI